MAASSQSPPASAAAWLPQWQAAWPAALAIWSRFTKLAEPIWLLDPTREQQAGLEGGFAQIRLTDHSILIGLHRIARLGLGRFAPEVLAHEIGHHVLAPADLSDNARLLARLRAALPEALAQAPLVGNLYTDLLINDRLAREAQLDLAGLYQALNTGDPGNALWNLYLRVYEQLWSLPAGTLTPGTVTAEMRADAALAARLIRAYSRDWLEGAGRFARLLQPYLPEKPEGTVFESWLDAAGAGAGESIPDGLTQIEEAENRPPPHPRDDPALSGLDRPGRKETGEKPARASRSGGADRRARPHRGPVEYARLLKAAGVEIPQRQLVMHYYKELARRHWIAFPSKTAPRAGEPLPEGLDPWDLGEPVAAIDWIESLARQPRVIPGVTTVQRRLGRSAGNEREKRPLDLYLGIDCSGSMFNPALRLSYPVLAGTVLALSALRARARVMACLSGEPGEYVQTDGFVRRESEILRLLTGYLGTGFAFGLGRLKETFLDGPPPVHPTHVLILSDSDWFYMLDRFPDGWALAERAALRAGGGATALLHLPRGLWMAEKSAIQRLKGLGWQVHLVSTAGELVDFARAFARRTYQDAARGRS